MDAAELERRMEREREFWVDVAPGKRVKFLRPLMDEAMRFAKGFSMEAVCEYLRGWEGFTEADLLKTGTEAPLDFDMGNAAKALRDHLGWTRKIAKAMSQAITDRAAATADAEKNSVTS